MIKNKEIIEITKKITNIYNYLFNLEFNNKLDDEYYNCLPLLKDLLNKENELYSELSENELICLEQYSSQDSMDFDDILITGIKNLDNGKLLLDRIIMKERIKSRLAVYQYVNIFEDNNWYNNIYNGVYLSKNNKDEDQELVKYIYIQSLYTTLSYINVINNLETTDITLAWKYLFIYIEPFIEKYVIDNNFKISSNGEYIIRLSSIVNKNEEYVTSAKEIFYEYLVDICEEILEDKFKRINDFFMLNITCIKSFLSILSEDDRRELVNYSNDKLKENGYPESVCIDTYFNLFDECQYVKKKV